MYPSRYHNECDPCVAGQMEENGLTEALDVSASGVVAATAVTFAKSFTTAPTVIVGLYELSDETVIIDTVMAQGVTNTGFIPKLRVDTGAVDATVKIAWQGCGV